jgi:hypothetical protein
VWDGLICPSSLTLTPILILTGKGTASSRAERRPTKSTRLQPLRRIFTAELVARNGERPVCPRFTPNRLRRITAPSFSVSPQGVHSISVPGFRELPDPTRVARTYAD